MWKKPITPELGAPGVIPAAAVDLQATITQNGRDMNSRALGGGQVGYVGAATATSATTLTATGTPWSSSQWIGSRVIAQVSGTVMAQGNIISNTSSQLTVDQWSIVTSPNLITGLATPSSTGVFIIQDGNAPAWLIGLGNTNTAVSATDTFLSDENTTSGGGLIRQRGTYTHTATVNSFALAPTYTCNSADVTAGLPTTIYRIGVFSSIVASNHVQTMMFETMLSAAATLSALGDQLTVTETITLS